MESTLVVGHNYTVICSGLGVEDFLYNSTILSYQWTKDNGTETKISTLSDDILSFTPFKNSDSGNYSCQATVVLDDTENEILLNSSWQYLQAKGEFTWRQPSLQQITLTLPTCTVPPPEQVYITSDPTSPVVPESNVSITCTVELSPAIDTIVTVNIKLSDPKGSPLNVTSLAATGSTYPNTTIIISSFGRDESGKYSCTASISSTTSFIINSGSKSALEEVSVGNTWINFRYMILLSFFCRSLPFIQKLVAWKQQFHSH